MISFCHTNNLLTDIETVVTIHTTDFVEGDDIGTMNTHELRIGQHVFHRFHRQMGHQRTLLAFEIEHHVVLHPFYIKNLSKGDLTYIIQNLAQLDAMADVIIIDTGAGISDAVLEFLVASGEILLVTTPEPTSITDSYSLLKALNRHPRFSTNNTQIKVITNRVENEREGEVLFSKLNVVVGRYLGLPLTFLGSVPQDKLLSQSVMQQLPVSLAHPGAKSAEAYSLLAEKLIDPDSDRTLKKRGMAALFSHIVANKRNL